MALVSGCSYSSPIFYIWCSLVPLKHLHGSDHSYIPGGLQVFVDAEGRGVTLLRLHSQIVSSSILSFFLSMHWEICQKLFY